MARISSNVDPASHRSSSSSNNQTAGANSADAIDELRNAFDLAERSSPGISELFSQLILTRLQQPGNVAEDRARVAVERLARSN